MKESIRVPLILDLQGFHTGGFHESPASRAVETALMAVGSTDRPHSSSFLGLPCRILNMNPQKELLWGLWVEVRI